MIQNLTVDLKKFVLYWNDTFPIDYWWRKKYKIAFNSNIHREANLIDEKFEYLEELLFDSSRQEEKEKRKKEYLETGVWLKSNKSSLKDEEIDELYDNIDLKDFNKIEDAGT